MASPFRDGAFPAPPSSGRFGAALSPVMRLASGIAIGIAVGAGLGALLGNLPIGIAVGIAIGIGISLIDWQGRD